MMMRWMVLGVVLVGCAETPVGIAASELAVAFGHCDITPSLDEGHAVWLAGYGPGRRATGVHDPIYARAVVMQSGDRKIAVVGLDLIGLQLPAVERIRAELEEFEYVLVASTHNHEGPDVIGIWGKTLLHRGVDDGYVDRVIRDVVKLIRQLEDNVTPARARYGTAEDATLLGDSRLPIVKDGVLRLLRFESIADGRHLGIILQWNCHPEALGSKNTLITADFPAETVRVLTQRFGGDVVYLCGALGGLMAPPRQRIRDDEGRVLGTGEFAFAQRYGKEVAHLAIKAVERAQPARLTPWHVVAKRLLVPVENPWYRAARVAGVLRRESRLWTGDPEEPGEVTTLAKAGQLAGIVTEVAYLRLGEIHVACVPGELYPELVYGQFQDPADPAADFPDAPLEPSLAELMPSERWLLVGLANDEIGYLIPRRQWDGRFPFAYGRATGQYGEINSCGARAAPLIMEGLARCIREAGTAQAAASP